MSRRQLAGFLVLSLIWGSTWAAIRVVVQHMPPLRSVSFRFLLASVVLLPIMLVRRPRLPKGREWGVLIVLGIAMVVLPFSLVAWAEQRISSGMTSVIFATSPLFTAWMESFVGRPKQSKRVPPMALFAMLAGFGGMVLVLSGAISTSSTQAGGAVAVLLVVVVGSATSILAKHELKGIPPLTASTVQCLVTGVLLGLTSLVVERGQVTHWTISTIAAMLFLGVVSSALAFLIFYWLIVDLEPYKLAARQLIMPVVAIAEGILLLHEPLPWTMVVGALVVLVSVVIVLRVKIDGDDLPYLNSTSK